MREPGRLIDDPRAPRELSALLRQVPRARPLDPGSRRRVERRLLAATAIPVATGAWITAKTALAGFALAAGTTAVGASIVHGVRSWTAEAPSAASHSPPPGGPKPGKVWRDSKPAESPTRAAAEQDREQPSPARRVRDEIPAPAALPREPTPPSPAVTPSEAAFTGASSASGLAAESALLDRARRALGSDPALALSLTDQHLQRFPKPYLATERGLIRIDALLRLGRRDEAQALAASLVAHDQNNLYRERIRRLFDRGAGSP